MLSLSITENDVVHEKDSFDRLLFIHKLQIVRSQPSPIKSQFSNCPGSQGDSGEASSTLASSPYRDVSASMNLSKTSQFSRRLKMSYFSHSRFKLAACVLLFLEPGLGVAQSSGGQVEGTVFDTQKAVLAQSSVSLCDSQGHVIQKAVTDASGHYEFLSITAGTYILRFAHAGFQAAEDSSVVVVNQSPTHLDFAMQPERLNQTVTVSALEDPLTVTTSIGTHLDLDPLHTPADLAIVTSETLSTRGYEQIEEAVRSMPGASSGGSPADPSQFVVRGFVGNQVTLLRDGIYVGPANMVNRSENSFNLQSVELLQGPGSVLYGQGSVGGTINVLTKKPVFEAPSLNVYSSYGSFNTYELGIGGGGQINRHLAFRSDFSYYASDGYVVDSNPRNLNGTGSLLWKIRDNLSMRMSLDAIKDDLSSYYGTPFVPGSFGTDPIKGVLQTSNGTVLDARMRYKNYNVSDAELGSTSYQPAVTFTWQPTTNINITEQGYYYHATRSWENAETYTFLGPNNGQVDANGNPIPGNVIARDRFHVFHNQNLAGNSLSAGWSHKLFGLTNKLSGGYDFYNINLLRSRGFPNAQYADYVDPLNPVQGAYGNYAGDFPSLVSPTKITDNAGYFEDALSVTHNLVLVTGIRFENFYLDRLNYSQGGSLQPSLDFSGNYHPVNYRAGLVYSLTPSLIAYGQFSTAQDPPGDNIFTVNATTPPFQLSNSKEGEVGVKAILPNGLGEATLALYDIDRKKILTVNPITSASDNNGNQTSKGFEFSTNLHPIHLVDLNFNTAYVAAIFGTYVDPNTGLNDAGKIPADVPATTSNLWVDVRRLGKVPLELGGGLRFMGGRYADNANQTKLFNYSTFDIYGAYHLKERFALTARMKNLFDKAYAQWADVNYPPEIVLGAPRSFTVSFTGRF
jgi:iron complex outermembrane receptor protein